MLLLPLAQAAPAMVRLEAGEGVWNGVTEVVPGEGESLLWVPVGARIHQVGAVSGGVATPLVYRAEGDQALRVEAAAGADLVRASYDFRPGVLVVARYVAPEDHAVLVLEVVPPPGLAVSAGGIPFPEVEPGVQRAEVAALPRGAEVVLRLVDPTHVGEVAILLSVAFLSLLVLVGTLAWHRVRPPLAGREPTGFLDHLRELQARLLPPVLVFLLLNVVYFVTDLRVAHAGGVAFVVPVLSDEGGLAARAFDALAHRLVPPDVQLVVLRPADAVVAQILMALFLAFATLVPLLAYELGAFLAPALLPGERRVAVRSLPLVSGLVLAGALFGYLGLGPLLMRTLYAFAQPVGALPLLGLNELVSFALLLVFAFGLAFELPVVMYVLARLGVVQASTFRRYLRHALVAIVLLAGLLTPDPTVVSQLLVALPVAGLYLLGLFAAHWGERARLRAIPA